MKSPRQIVAQMQEAEEEDLQARSFVHRQDDEEEEVQAKTLTNRQESEEEEIQPRFLLQRKDSEEEEKVQAKKNETGTFMLKQNQVAENEEEGEIRTTVNRESSLTVQKQSELNDEEETLQSKNNSGSYSDITPETEVKIMSQKGGGQPLSDSTRAFFEQRFGNDFSSVRVHADHKADESAKSINAQAYTLGNDIVFSQGRYPPDAESGKRLLGHELTHVLQQRIGGLASHGLLQKQIASEKAGDVAKSVVGEITGTPLRRPGVMACTKKSPNEQYLRKAPKPRTKNNLVSTLFYNERIFVEEKGGSKNEWYKITTPKGFRGWVPKISVALDPPEPGAKLYRVKPGDKAIFLAGRWYGPPGGWKRWWWPGSDDAGDARFYVGALAFANRGRAGMPSPDALTERAAWEKVQVIEGFTIWKPSKPFLQTLKGRVNSGSITKELWEDVKKVAKKIWEFAVFAAAFISGLIYGVGESIYDLFAGIVELVKMVWSVGKSIITGNIVSDAKEFWEDLKNIDVSALSEDFKRKWLAPDPWDAGFFQGRVLGYVIMEIVLLVASGGILTALKWAGKFAKIGALLSKLPRIAKIAEAAAKAAKLPSKAKNFLKARAVEKTGKAFKSLTSARKWAAKSLKLKASILKDLTLAGINRLRRLPDWAIKQLRSLSTSTKRLILGCKSICKVNVNEILKVLKVPQGLSIRQWRKFRRAARKVAREAKLPSGELAVHGSRAKGISKVGKDIDVILRVDEKAFFEFTQARIASVRQGTKLHKTLLKAARKGKLSRFDISPEFNKILRKYLHPTVPYDIDFSIIKIGSKFDTGPFIPIGRF
jgi:hypothetical protein